MIDSDWHIRYYMLIYLEWEKYTRNQYQFCETNEWNLFILHKLD